MHLTLRSVIEVMTILGVLSSLGFYILSAVGIASFLGARRRKNAAGESAAPLPPVSILKPLKGIDPNIFEAFCSHCEQDYPEYELIFGVGDLQDPAVEAVRRLQATYPHRRIELVVCSRDLGTNRKLSTLAQMLPSARYDTLLVNDSDIGVEPAYLCRVTAPLANPAVGMVTCLYRGIAAPTLGSRLEALGISTDFVPGVLSALVIENGLHFGLGSTLVFRRADLQAIGGFEAMLDYLADDYELGHRIAALDKRVELSPVVVDTYLPSYSLRAFFDHQLRWARSVRGARSWGYVGLILTYGVPWALALLLLSRGAAWAWWLAGLAVFARLAVGMASGLVALGDSRSMRDLHLLLLRDLIAPLVWALGLVGNRILWRGDIFYLEEGRLVRPLGASAQPELSHLPRP
ncbi:MAG TPA: bacteriohopanetetrol glucosamine biosynthesis glycosyltransferase HpnI [Terriglobales bacterium]|nr:bacteriohopanetetrol glucosamine biosynthesis glycosyltransferase HpnI [Terriglobales bacterium]